MKKNRSYASSKSLTGGPAGAHPSLASQHECELAQMGGENVRVFVVLLCKNAQQAGAPFAFTRIDSHKKSFRIKMNFFFK